jgi:hypothetical protein
MVSGVSGSSVKSGVSLLQDVNNTEAKYKVVKMLNSFMVWFLFVKLRKPGNDTWLLSFSMMFIHQERLISVLASSKGLLKEFA